MASLVLHTFPLRLLVLMFIPTLLLFFSIVVLYDSTRLLRLIQDIRPRCNLVQICPWYAVRPILSDGSQSTAIFDIPRRMLNHIPSHVVSFLSPTARLVTSIQRPRIIVYDSALPPRLQSHLLRRARAVLYTKRQRSNNASFETQQVILSPYAYEDEVRIVLHYWVLIISSCTCYSNCP